MGNIRGQSPLHARRGVLSWCDRPANTSHAPRCTSLLSWQGSAGEVSQTMSLLPALIHQPGVTEAFLRFGVADFLAWRISAERKLAPPTRKDVERENEWQFFLPEQLVQPKVGSCFCRPMTGLRKHSGVHRTHIVLQTLLAPIAKGLTSPAHSVSIFAFYLLSKKTDRSYIRAQ